MGLFKRKNKKYFDETAEEKVDHICDTLLEHKLYDAEKKAREQYYKISAGDFAVNYQRELIPVVTRADLRIKKLDNELEEIKKECNTLIARVQEICDKKERFEKIFDKISKSPLANHYALYEYRDTNQLMLINGQYNSQNITFGTREYPAVICLDLLNNDITEKYIWDDLRDDGIYPSNIVDMMKDALAIGQNLSFSSTEDIEQSRKIISLALEDAAESYENLYEIRRKQIEGLLGDRSVWEEATDFVNKARNSGDLSVHIQPRTHEIYYEHNNAAIILHYCDEGITSGYYLNPFHKVVKVYDVKECCIEGNGFLWLSDSNYKAIINSQTFSSLLSIENLAIEDITKTAEREMERIGTRTYIRSELMTKEPINLEWWLNDSEEELNQRMFKNAFEYCCRLEDYYHKEEIAVQIDYNPYNNSINIEQDGDIAIVMFDKAGELFEISHKELNKNLPPDHLVLKENVVRNKEVFEASKFQMLYKGIEKIIVNNKMQENGDNEHNADNKESNNKPEIKPETKPEKKKKTFDFNFER